MANIELIKQKIQPVAFKYNLRGVYLFGSVARGEAEENSDIDIIVDTEDSKAASLFALGSLYEDLKETLKCSVDLMTFRRLSECRDDPDSYVIYHNIRKDMVKIYDRT